MLVSKFYINASVYDHDTPGNCLDVECFKLLVSQNNNVCVCGCVGELVGGWERACVRECVRVCVHCYC